MPKIDAETIDAEKKIDTENTNSESNGNNGAAEPETAETEKKVVPLSTFISEKKKRQEIEAELNKYREQQKKIEEDKLKEDGKLQELIAAKEKELEEKDNQMKALEEKAQAFEAYRQSKVDNAKKALGENWVDDYEKLSIAALDKLVSLTEQKKKPSTDGGVNADLKGVELTPAQKKEAHSQFPQLPAEKAEKMWREVLIKRGKIKTE